MKQAKATTLSELRDILNMLALTGHNMQEDWWGFDDGSLNTDSIHIECGHYDPIPQQPNWLDGDKE